MENSAENDLQRDVVAATPPTRLVPAQEEDQAKSGLVLPAGFANLGNTCYMNSTLQCLLCCPILANYMQSGHHSRNCSTVGFCAFCELERLSGTLRAGRARDAVRPKAIVLNVRTMGRQFRRGRQEDAHEFLRCLLDSMQKATTAALTMFRAMKSATPKATRHRRIEGA